MDWDKELRRLFGCTIARSPLATDGGATPTPDVSDDESSVVERVAALLERPEVKIHG